MEFQLGSKLLAIPPEVVEKILSHVTDEALLPLRLTCKTLHDLSFDYFMGVYFWELGCCISQIDRFLRLRDIINGDARITNNIVAVHFWRNILEGRRPSDVSSVARKLQSPQQSMIEAIDVLYENTYEGFDIMLVNSILLDFKRLAPHVKVCFHFDDPHPFPPKLREFQHDRALSKFPFCLATTDITLSALSYSPWNLPYMTWVLHYYRESFLSLVRGVEVICWLGPMLDLAAQMDTACDIFKAASSLDKARLVIGDHCSSKVDGSFEVRLGTLQPKVFLAGAFSKLRALDLQIAMLSDVDLTNALDRCKSTLEEIGLFFIPLKCSIGGWTSIVQKLLTIPTLKNIVLHVLAHFEESGDDTAQFSLLALPGKDDKKRDSAACSDTENVHEFLRDLADRGFRDRDMSDGSTMTKSEWQTLV